MVQPNAIVNRICSTSHIITLTAIWHFIAVHLNYKEFILLFVFSLAPFSSTVFYTTYFRYPFVVKKLSFKMNVICKIEHRDFFRNSPHVDSKW